MIRVRVPREVADKLLAITWKEIKEQQIIGSGPGGQNKNKVHTGVRLIHKSTKIQAEATKSKSQKNNKKNAYEKLIKKLIEFWSPILKPETKNTERIRTYNEARGKVKDHRTGVELNYNDVLNGEIAECIESIQKKRGE